jgi:oxygen-independent coproporphyrinogen-3 oxidase
MEGYEVSQFAAAPEHRSRHNLKYWDHTPYLGLGPAAHSYRDRERWWNLRRTDPWQEAIDRGVRPVEASESLDSAALTLEALMTGLRTHAGVDLGRMRDRWGVDVAAANRELIERVVLDGLATRDGERLVPTLDGLAVADVLAARFFLPSP